MEQCVALQFHWKHAEYLTNSGHYFAVVALLAYFLVQFGSGCLLFGRQGCARFAEISLSARYYGVCAR